MTPNPAMTFGTFDMRLNPKMQPAFMRCRDIIGGEVKLVLLVGGFGVGKTHLANAAANVYSPPDALPPIVWKVPDFLAFLRSRIDAGDLELIVQSYGRADCLLVLDDLGAENRTDWAGEQLYRILDRRYEEKAPTILTSNEGLNKLDQRIVSRFRSGLVICEGRDQRGPR